MKTFSHLLALGLAIDAAAAALCRPSHSPASSASSVSSAAPSSSSSAAPVPPPPPPCTNVIKDADFADLNGAWTSGVNNYATITGLTGSSCYTTINPCVQIKVSPVTDGPIDNYGYVESQPFTLALGVTYTLKFDMYEGFGGSNLEIHLDATFNDVGNSQRRSVGVLPARAVEEHTNKLHARVGSYGTRTFITVGTGAPQTLRIQLSSKSVTVTAHITNVILMPTSCFALVAPV